MYTYKRFNKKASVLDFFLIIVIAMMSVITLVLCLIVNHKVSDTGIFNSDLAANRSMNMSRNTLLSMDNMILFIIVGLSLFTLITAYLSVNHPMFFFFIVLFLAIAVMVAANISNSYETFRTQPTISAEASLLPKTTFLMDKLPLYIAFMGFLTILCMYIGYKQNG